MESRYDLTVETVHNNFGSSMLVRIYNDSISHAFNDLYPEHKWHPWLFGRAPGGIWKSGKTRREYLDWLAPQVGVVNKEDWYNVTIDSFKGFHGGGMLSTLYNDSVAAAVMENLTEHNWRPWRFRQVPTGYWERPGSRRYFFDAIAPELGVSKLEDWYAVGREEVRRAGGGGLVTKRFYKLSSALMDAYPDHAWDPTKFGPTAEKDEIR